ncbi:MAG TPA: HAD hydrolase-like protein [bacterium]|nr:HAD hydrolase-like protein [bacterium]HPL95525.1 HAD hydrolase-like protein [bacterium]
MLKNIIFDWSGTISDNTKKVYLTAMAIFKKFGVKKISFKDFRKNFKLPVMLFYNQYIPNLSLSEEKKIYAEEYAKLKKSTPYKSIDKIIKNLAKRDLNLVVISTDPPAQLKKEIKKFDLENVFMDIESGVHDKYSTLKKNIKKNKFRLSETIFIADTKWEIEIGNKIGIKTGGVTWGIGTLKEISEAKPTYLINNIAKFKKIFNET